MLAAAGLNPEDWDTAELASMLEAQWAQIESVRTGLIQSDEPAHTFDARWQ
jgi:hypothetical protein